MKGNCIDAELSRIAQQHAPKVWIQLMQFTKWRLSIYGFSAYGNGWKHVVAALISYRMQLEPLNFPLLNFFYLFSFYMMQMCLFRGVTIESLTWNMQNWDEIDNMLQYLFHFTRNKLFICWNWWAMDSHFGWLWSNLVEYWFKLQFLNFCYFIEHEINYLLYTNLRKLITCREIIEMCRKIFVG